MNKEHLQILIEKGNEVLRTHVPSTNTYDGFIAIPTSDLDSAQFAAWRARVVNYLDNHLPENNSYLNSFKENVKEPFYRYVLIGIELLKSIDNDISLNISLGKVEDKIDPISKLINIFNKFHLIVRQLRNRFDERPTLDINDEYDVQNLLHTLLILYFNDIRPEEWTPSYAGRSSRMDFLLKDYKIVIEVKKTRSSLRGKEVGSQLIEDIKRYEKHPDCETLLCFVYDPEGLVGNPKGLENDLSEDNGKINVQVYVRPN